MSDPMDRNGAMEQSQSVVPLTQIVTPSHLGLIMPPLHRNAHYERGACSGHGAAVSGHGVAAFIRAGCPWGIYWAREAHAVSWQV